MEKVDNDTWNSNLQGYVNCIGRLAEILDYMYKDCIKMLYNGYIQVIIILMNILKKNIFVDFSSNFYSPT